MRGAPACIFTLIFLLGASVFVFAQPENDSLKANRELETAYTLFLSAPDSSITLAKHVLGTTSPTNHRYLTGYAFYILSKANWTKANYRLSMEYGFKALRILENTTYTNAWGECLLVLSRTSMDLQNLDQAAHFLKRAYALAAAKKDQELLAAAYREHSMLLVNQKKYDSALLISDKGLVIYHANQDSLNESIILNRKARTYFNLGHYKKSMALVRTTLRLDSLVGNRRALGISYLLMAQNATVLHHYDSAILCLKRSISINHELSNISTLIRAHSLLADVYSATNRPTLAVEQLRLANQFKDSLYNAERNGHIQEMQSLYELETKDKTINLLERENELRSQQVRNQRILAVALVTVIVLLGTLIFALIRLRHTQTRANKTLSDKNAAIEHQKEEIQTQAENLQHLNQLKSKLFSVISHDLRGPIGNLQALLELLASRLLTPEEFLSLSDKLKTNLNATQSTLENLLSWSLSQMEGIKTEHQKIDIKTLIDDACKLLEGPASGKNVTIVSNATITRGVIADPNQIHLILRNLIHNAIKFSKRNGMVIVSAYPEGDNCCITIKDSGIGMTEEEVHMIVDSEHFTKMGTQQEKGTGLGLLLCKEFIHRNGGTLTVTSTQGQGTAVSFSIPLGTE